MVASLAHELHLALGLGEDGKSVGFQVTGGKGTITRQRLYQLSRQQEAISDGCVQSPEEYLSQQESRPSTHGISAAV